MIDRQRILDAWRRLDVVVRDLPLALLITGLAFVPAMRGYGTRVGELPPRPLDGWAVLGVLLEALPLALRRKWPMLSLALVSVGFAIDQLRVYHLFSGNAMTIALVNSGAHLERGRRTCAIVLTVVYAALAVALGQQGAAERAVGFVSFYLAMVLAWAIGAWLRATRVAEAERRERVAAETLAAERTRLARELHDVVTHHVTAMVVQAEAARYLTQRPDRLENTLEGITDTGRSAIADLRHLLDLLDPTHSPRDRTAPAESIDTLVERTRRSGQPVELTQIGAAANPGGSAELVAHHVVREALTNALKYARGSATKVAVRHTNGEVVVAVRTAGGGGGRPAHGPIGGSGRGLSGLRDRVEALGGTFTTGVDDDGVDDGGGFVVHARIPSGDAS